jgi:RimJ/RimL family protein N-acetyltransferase
MPEKKTKIAYKIITDRTVIRCWNPEDAPLLKTAIDKSLEHLREWMPWAHQEPESVEAKAARLRSFRGSFDLDKDYIYGIFNLEETRVLGGTGLHTRAGENALEIGYWIHVDSVNQGLATEVAGALTKAAFEINKTKRVEIHCDPDNIKSARIPEKLGFVHEAVLRNRVETADGTLRDAMIWTMLAEEYPLSSLKDIGIEAFDCLGQKLL